MADGAGRQDGVLVALLLAAAYGVGSPCVLHDESLALLGLPGVPAAAAATPLAAALRQLVQWTTGLGLGVHVAASWLAAIAGGGACFAAHGAARCAGASRRAAAVAALFVGTCPAAVMAATSIHVHAFVLLGAAIATWLAVAVARGGSVVLAVLLGLGCGVAHASAPVGALLPLVVLPLLLLEAAAVEPRRLRRAGLQAALVLGLGTGLAALLRAGRLTTGMPTVDQVLAWDLGTLGPLLLRDAGRSFLPLSLVVLAALWSRVANRHALVLVAAAVPAVLLGCHLTTTRGDDGAFLLPLLPAAALLAARWLSPRVAIVALVVSLGLAATKVALRADWHEGAEFAAGVREASAGRGCWLVTGPHRDEGFVLARLPEVHQERIVPVAAPAATRGPAALVEALLGQARAGRCVLLTDEAEMALRDPLFRAAYPGAVPLLRELAAAFTWRQVLARGFAGHELVPR